MSLRWSAGAELANVDAYYNVVSSVINRTETRGYWSLRSFGTSTTTGSGRTTLGIDAAEWYVGGGFYYTSGTPDSNGNGNGFGLIGFWDLTTVQCCVTVDSGVINCRRTNGTGTILAGSGAKVLVQARWYFIEVRAKISDTVGIMEVWVDDEVWVTMAATQDTKVTANAYANQLSHGGNNNWRWDDLYALDTGTGAAPWNTRLGDVGIPLLVPNGVGGQTEWDAQAQWDTVIGGRTTYGWYKLDETTGTNAADSSGSSRDGTYENTPTLNEDGKESIRAGDNAVTFNGTDEDVLLPSGLCDIPTATSASTLEFWAKFPFSNSNETTVVVGGRKSSSGNAINTLGLFQQSDGQGIKIIYSTRDDNGAGLNQMTARFASWATGGDHHDPRGCGHWHHYVAVRDTDKSKRIYFDGILRATSSDTMATGATSLDWSYIARERQAAVYKACTLSEVAVYRVALTAEEVFENFRAGSFNWEMTDDMNWAITSPTPAADDDSSYVSTSTIDDRDLYALTDLPSAMGDPKGLTVYVRGKKLSAGLGKIAIGVKYDSDANGTPDTESYGADIGLSTAYFWEKRLLETQPDASAWTSSNVNALEAGQKAR